MRNVIGLLKHIHNDLGNAALTTKNTNILVKQLYKILLLAFALFASITFG